MIDESEIPMICDTLQKLVDDNVVTPKELTRLLNLKNSGSVYRYLSGETAPTFQQTIQIFRFCKNPQIQYRILNTLSADENWVHYQLDANLDVNGDKVVNTEDVLDAAINATGNVQKILTKIRTTQKVGMKRMSGPQAEQLSTEIDQAIESLLAGRRVVNMLSMDGVKQ